jgi:type I restriction-modification system DNA methylase subunit
MFPEGKMQKKRPIVKLLQTKRMHATSLWDYCCGNVPLLMRYAAPVNECTEFNDIRKDKKTLSGQGHE